MSEGFSQFGFGGGAGDNPAGQQQDGAGLVLDLENVEAAKFDVVPAGIYDAIVEDCEFKTASTGSPMLVVKFRTQVPEGKPGYNRLFFNNFVLNHAFGLQRLKAFLQRIAPEYPLTGFNPQAFADSGVVVGRACRIRINIKANNGQKQNNITEVLEGAPGGASSAFFGG